MPDNTENDRYYTIHQRFKTTFDQPEYAGGYYRAPPPSAGNGSGHGVLFVILGFLALCVALAGAVFVTQSTNAATMAAATAAANDESRPKCTSPDCVAAWQAVEIERQRTARAIASVNANARAGFGNDDGQTQQTAVLPWPKREVTRVVRNYDQDDVQINTDIVDRPRLRRPGCDHCGAAPSVNGSGHATIGQDGRCVMHGDGHDDVQGYVWPDRRCHTNPPPAN